MKNISFGIDATNFYIILPLIYRQITSYPGLIYQNNGNWIVTQVILLLFDNSLYKFQHIFVVWQKLRHNLYPYQHTLAGKPHIVIAAGNPIIYAMK